MKKILLLGLIFISFLNVGWFSTYKIDIRDVSNFYTTVDLKNAPEVLLSNLNDQRENRSLVGKIGSLKFVPEISVNKVFTDRIAARLKTYGFNIKKQKISQSQKKVSKTLHKKNAIKFITGDIFRFSFTEIDPGNKHITGRCVYNIAVYNKRGLIAYEKYFFISVYKRILDKPLSDAEYIVEELLNASMDTLFNDPEFTTIMDIGEIQYKKLKDYVYYDKNLSEELNSLFLNYKVLKTSKKEFLKGRDELINSF